jgi:hypothetical protein
MTTGLVAGLWIIKNILQEISWAYGSQQWDNLLWLEWQQQLIFPGENTNQNKNQKTPFQSQEAVGYKWDVIQPKMPADWATGRCV